MLNSELWQAPLAGGADFYDHQIVNSVRFTGSGRLTKTAGTPTNIDKFTISFWVKRSDVTAQNNLVFGDTDNINYQMLRFNSAEKLELHEQRGGGDSNGLRTVNQVFRDPSAWMHVVWVYDSGNSTEADREIFYVNGTRLTDVEGWDGGYPAQNRDSVFNQSGATQVIGGASAYYGNHLDGYMAEVVFNDGQAYAASNYGETKNGVWIPKDPSGLTFGDNGFYLNFASSGDLGNDVSGNNNDFALTNIATHDQMLDSPTFNSSSNGGNFCTANSVYRGESTTASHYGVLSEGNLTHTYSGSSDGAIPCTHKVPASGKWYFEYRIDAGGGTSNYSPAMGIMDPNEFTFTSSTIGQDGLISYDNAQNRIEKNDVIVGTYGGSRGSNGDVMGIAVDMDNGAFYVSKNGTFQAISGGSTGDPTSGASKTGAGATWTPASEYTSGMVPMSQPTGGNAPIITINFGQNGTFNGNETAGGNSDTNGYGNFFSAVPSGYSAICSGALTVPDAINPALTEDDFPQKLFQALTYTGTGSSGSITTKFQPDFIWMKNRGATKRHYLVDSNRGINSTSPYLHSDQNVSEGTGSSAGVSGVSSTSISFGGALDYVNASSNTYVSWHWRANGGTTSSGSGDLTSTHQVDPSGGFSIVKAVGDGGSGDKTVSHGLSAAPTVILSKNINASYNWDTYFAEGVTAGSGMRLNTTETPFTGRWGTINSSIFTCKDNYTWDGTNNYIYYCFTNTEGYIKSGSFVGNGNTDGPFIYTGFRPSLVVRKRFDGSGSWLVKDDARNPTNDGSIEVLTWNSDGAENPQTETSDGVDFLSNGFKLKATNNGSNGDGLTYVYLAISFNPFKYSTAF